MSVESCAWLCNLCFCLSFYPINCKNILPCCPLVARRWHAALCDEGLARLPNGLSRNVFRHVLRCEMRRIADPSGRRHGIAPVLLCFIAVHGLVAYHRSAAAYGGRLSCNANGGMVSPGSSFVLVFSCFPVESNCLAHPHRSRAIACYTLSRQSFHQLAFSIEGIHDGVFCVGVYLLGLGQHQLDVGAARSLLIRARLKLLLILPYLGQR